MGEIIKVKKTSGKVLALGLVIVFLLGALKNFDVIDLSTHLEGVLVLIGALFLLAEFGSSFKKNAISAIGTIVAGAAIIGALLGFFGVSIELLDTIKGFVHSALIVFVLYEVFVRK